MTISFEYIEDYIQFIGGTSVILSPHQHTKINLARYDVGIVASFCNQIALGRAFTDKQAELALKIVDKYRKQMLKLSPPVSVPDTSKKFKFGVRQITRTKTALIRDRKIILQFPYESKLIDQVKTQAKSSQGSCRFNYETKEWTLAITEHNVNWLCTIADQYSITIHQDIFDLFTQILETEKNHYKIELQYDSVKFFITNAAPSLNQYIENNLGGFHKENLLALVDNASVLGYQVHPDVNEMLKLQYDSDLMFLIKHKLTTMPNESKSFDKILQYAKLVNRLPIYVYDNGLPKKDTEEIIYLNAKFSHSIKPKLMVRTGELMFGTRKTSWVVNSEKIITLKNE